MTGFRLMYDLVQYRKEREHKSRYSTGKLGTPGYRCSLTQDQEKIPAGTGRQGTKVDEGSVTVPSSTVALGDKVHMMRQSII